MFNIARNGCSAWSDIPAQLGAKQALNFAEIRNGLQDAAGLLAALRGEIVQFGIRTSRGGAGGDEGIELDKIPVRELVRGLGRLTIGSWILIATIALSLVGLGTRLEASRKHEGNQKPSGRLDSLSRRQGEPAGTLDVQKH